MIEDGSFDNRNWDRLGNTFLESREKTEKELGLKKGDLADDRWAKLRRNIKSDLQFGMGISLRPVEIRRHTETNKAGVEGRRQRHGPARLPLRCACDLYHAFLRQPALRALLKMPPRRSGVDAGTYPRCLPAHRFEGAALRRGRMAHYLEHVDALGSFPDLTVLEALKQRAESSTWSAEDAKAFLKERAPGFARYRELVSGLEVTPNQLS